MKPFLSIIIPVYNDAESLKICLRAVSKQTYLQNNFEVIIVNNGLDKLENLNELGLIKNLRINSEPKQSQFAARNNGVKSATGNILVFTDADCVPESQWLEEGVKCLLSQKGCGIVGGAVHFLFEEDSPNIIELYDSLFFLQQKRYVEEIGFAVTANLFTFKEIFNECGLFDERLKSGGDGEWGKRVYGSGYQVLYAPNAAVCHPARSNLSILLKKIRRVTGGKYIRENRASESVYRFWKTNVQEMLFGINRIIRLEGIKLLPKTRLLLIEIVVQLSKMHELFKLKQGKIPERQ